MLVKTLSILFAQRVYSEFVSASAANVGRMIDSVPKRGNLKMTVPV